MRSIYAFSCTGLVLLCTLPAVCLPAGKALADGPAAYSKDQLMALDSIWGFGDPGKLDSSRQIVAPKSSDGFSIKADFPAHAGAPVNWWSIRTNLAGSTAGYDTLSFDLYVERADNSAALTISLAETDDNRWVAFDQPLSVLQKGTWKHFSFTRDNMRHWAIVPEQAFNWDNISRFTMEPRVAHSVFYIDNAELTGPGKKPFPMFSTQDDGIRASPAWHEPLQKALPPGSIVFPFDAGVAERDGGESASELQKAVGAPAGEPVNGFDHNIVSLSHSLTAHGIPITFYSQLMNGYSRYLTRRGAWDENADGRTMNLIPATQTWWDFEHTFSYAHPAVYQAAQSRIDNLIKAGMTTWFVVDYCCPWYDTRWGYSASMEQGYRKDLAGLDEGIHIRDGAKEQTIHFADYFRAYNGYFPKPSDIGITNWTSYVPPKPKDPVNYAPRAAMLAYLRSYEWVKLADRVGRYYKSKGGQGLWIVPNGESTYGSTDFVYISRTAGVGNLLPEWFGNIGLITEAGYASLPYLREQANRGGTRLSVNVETGCTGHSSPYWDWRIAYNGVYAITADSRADNFENDFLDESPYKVMSDPANTAQFMRFRDGVTKAKAFRTAFLEKAHCPTPVIVCVTDRPSGRENSGIFYGLDHAYSLDLGLSRAHLLYNLRDSLDLNQALGRFRVVAYSPQIPRVGDFQDLHNWLAEGSGRILVTHTFVPTRDARGFWNLDQSAKLGSSDGGHVLGLGRISTTNVTHCTVISARGVWSGLFPAGETIDLPTTLTGCQYGQPLVMTNAGPLVSMVHVGKGVVVYLHFTSRDTSNPEVSSLNIRAMKAVAEMAGIAPFCDADTNTSVMSYVVPGGRSIVAWDIPALKKWTFVYQAGIAPMRYEARGVDHTVSIPTGSEKPWLVYNFWADSLDTVQPRNGRISLALKDAVTMLCYVGPNTPELRATIAKARQTRAALVHDKFFSDPI